MNKEQKKQLFEMFESRVSFDSSMARRTTFKTGGKADAFLEVLEEEELYNPCHGYGKKVSPARLSAGEAT